MVGLISFFKYLYHIIAYQLTCNCIKIKDTSRYGGYSVLPWSKTTQHDMKSVNLSLNGATYWRGSESSTLEIDAR